MSKAALRLAAIPFLLLASCLGQVYGEAMVVSQALSEAHVNGSLSYWGRKSCSFSPRERYPVLPAIRGGNTSGPIAEILQQMFANDSKMQVAQEPNGIVRMFETDVPRDLLEIKIHHISFDVPDFNGPNMAIRLILSAPEVKKFRKAHKIGSFSDSDLYIGSSDSGPSYPRVSGRLDNVTVSQALDHIFQTYSGFWMYGNCPNGGKSHERTVYFFFYKTFPNNQ